MLKLWCERDTRFEVFLNQRRIEINWLQFCPKPYVYLGAWATTKVLAAIGTSKKENTSWYKRKLSILLDLWSNFRSFSWKCVIYYMLSSLSGVYSAAHDLNVEWIIIKGVSGFADGEESDTDAWRSFASLMAASFVAHILSNAIIFEDWPH